MGWDAPQFRDPGTCHLQEGTQISPWGGPGLTPTFIQSLKVPPFLSRNVFIDGVVVVQSLSHVRLFATPWTAVHQASLSFTISQSLLKHPTISSSVVPFSSILQSFPASGSFLMSWLFTSCGQSIEASASVLPMSIQDWFPLGWTGSPCCPRDSKESSPAPQVKSINSLALGLLYGPTLISIHDYWKNHSFD